LSKIFQHTYYIVEINNKIYKLDEFDDGSE